MIHKLTLFCVMMFLTAIEGYTGDEYDEIALNGIEPTFCFQCNSQQDPDCKNIQPNDTSHWAYKPCLDTDRYGGKTPFCRKIVQTIFPRENMEVVVRKCGWVPHGNSKDCYNVRNEDHVETICQCFSNACNSATGVAASLMIVTMAFLTSYVHLWW